MDKATRVERQPARSATHVFSLAVGTLIPHCNVDRNKSGECLEVDVGTRIQKQLLPESGYSLKIASIKVSARG